MLQQFRWAAVTTIISVVLKNLTVQVVMVVNLLKEFTFGEQLLHVQD